MFLDNKGRNESPSCIFQEEKALQLFREFPMYLCCLKSLPLLPSHLSAASVKKVMSSKANDMYLMGLTFNSL